MNNHIRSHHTDFKCDLCDFKSKEKTTIEEHTKKYQKYRGINLKGVTGIYDMKKQMFPCDYCKFKSNKMESVVEHFETKHSG